VQENDENEDDVSYYLRKAATNILDLPCGNGEELEALCRNAIVQDWTTQDLVDAIRALPPCGKCQTHVWVEKDKSSDAVDLLSQLVTALDNAFISSWQSTAAWKKELTAARDWLAVREDK